MKQVQSMDDEYSEVKKILHELIDEPGPSFSCYCLRADCTGGCLDCEIHCIGKRKPVIQITKHQLELCVSSETGRNQLKQYLKGEIDNLAGEEEEWGIPLDKDVPQSVRAQAP